MNVNDLMTSPWIWLVIVVVLFALAPIGLLWLAVHCYPRGHDRRRELMAEYWAWNVGERPLRVVEVTTMCVFRGTCGRREGSMIMARRTNRKQRQEKGIAAPDGSSRTLYWWSVPERPGVGRSMIKTTIVWFVSLFALLVVLGAIL